MSTVTKSSILHVTPLAASINGLSPPVTVDEAVCTLLPGMFGVAIQILLCGVSVYTLFFKYMHEHPRRPPKVFLMDFIQLMCGSSSVHVLNIVSSILISKLCFSANASNGIIQDECNMYFMTTLFDATLGVYIEFKIVRLLAIRRAAHDYLLLTRKSRFKPSLQELADATRLATDAITNNKSIISYETESLLEHDEESQLNVVYSDGQMGCMQLVSHVWAFITQPRIWLAKHTNMEFVNNLTTWLIIVCGLKVFSIVVFVVFANKINMIAAIMLSVFDKRHYLKLLFVMIGAPLVFNVFQYCVTDSIIKIKAPEVIKP